MLNWYLVQPVSELVVVDCVLHMKIVVFVGKIVGVCRKLHEAVMAKQG
jgi:hypothetical protein